MKFQTILSILIFSMVSNASTTEPSVNGEAKALAISMYGEECFYGDEDADRDLVPSTHSIENSRGETVRLVQVPCISGAYNFTSTFFLVNDFDEIIPLTFSIPDYEIVGQSEDLTAYDSIKVNGFGSTPYVNSVFIDEKGGTLQSYTKARGILSLIHI